MSNEQHLAARAAERQGIELDRVTHALYLALQGLGIEGAAADSIIADARHGEFSILQAIAEIGP